MSRKIKTMGKPSGRFVSGYNTDVSPPHLESWDIAKAKRDSEGGKYNINKRFKKQTGGKK